MVKDLNVPVTHLELKQEFKKFKKEFKQELKSELYEIKDEIVGEISAIRDLIKQSTEVILNSKSSSRRHL